MDIHKKPVKLNLLWKKNTVILKILRRLGCPMTRYECKLLTLLKPHFDKIGVRLVAITFEEKECQNFLFGGFWQGDLLVDKDRVSYRALGLNKQSALVGLSDLFTSSGRTAMKAAKEANIQGDFKGDGFQLGGTFIVKKGGGVVYEFRQNSSSVFPSIKEIYSIVGGNPDDVEEIAPLECVFHQGSKQKVSTSKDDEWLFNLA
ncbi:PRX_like2 domain-containing protein [Neoconidiobolus thromboides FSU 785]|nr:PRX_like2 domain-containing protein [Neoconidiobolus thromboides FSU 785]